MSILQPSWVPQTTIQQIWTGSRSSVHTDQIWFFQSRVYSIELYRNRHLRGGCAAKSSYFPNYYLDISGFFNIDQCVNNVFRNQWVPQQYLISQEMQKINFWNIYLTACDYKLASPVAFNTNFDPFFTLFQNYKITNCC